MKANFFAVALSLFVLSIPIYAATGTVSQQPAKPNLVKIDLNKADVKVLSHSFKGIGKKRAEAIVKYRGEQGKFNSIGDLARVRGFGKQFVKNHLSQLQEVFTTN